MLASVTVQAGTADPLLGGYRWVNIPDLYLTDNGQDGDYYVILAAQGGGDLWTDLGSQSLNSVMGTFSSGALIANNSGQTLGQDPAVLVGGSAGYGGPNLAFIEAVPEPATGALMFGGLLAFAAMFLKKHQKGAIRKFNEKLS